MTTEHNWTRIATIDKIPPREGRSAEIGGIEIAIFNLGGFDQGDGRILAIENACPHQGGPLCDGIVSGAVVVCPLHGWRFDLETGMAVRASMPACITTFPVRVEDGVVMVDVTAGHRIEPEDAAA